jgi:hypothetical protein
MEPQEGLTRACWPEITVALISGAVFVLAHFQALGHPLHQVMLSKDGSNEEYEPRMREALDGYLAAGVTCAAFGKPR